MIATVTLNPAVDRRYNIDIISINSVKRSSNYGVTAGGKGINVSRVLKILGESVKAFGFLGGAEGNFISERLKSLHINNKCTKIKGATRTCLNIIDQKNNTMEILEAGPVISQEEKKLFLDNFKSELNKFNLITISGSLPSGIESDFYARLIKIANKADKKVILDTSGDAFIEAINAGPYLIKPNQEEIENITKIKLIDRDDILKAVDKLRQMGANNVAISLGKAGMYYFSKEGNFQIKVPRIKVENATGSGDSVVAGFASSIIRNLDIREMLKFANACGVANALEKDTARINLENLKNLIKEIEINKF
ncbi:MULTISPECIES: 1-phosphofructokinase [unclassified Halanaerobium]|uniref:1-phosphofructokinase n=1 Tax=unclassified Halanaerobium TaxID=2641197 RepID=UPI000DF393AA|nr:MULTISPECIES: 1-phosphofructokinase [unclassified Halanaerobium]RCW48694.1 fructose-1-phosphate kinase [Halanaerobium sp. MA284_MarDTE_T2]RCW86562.1 fructose-1-phosphate kinase [Halanaerobium sp. DL-01]